MSTWGPSKKRSTSASRKSGASPRSGPAARKSAKAPTAKEASSKKAAGSVRDATPPGGEDTAQSSLRSAMGGREHEFVGLGSIGLAIVLGLAVYVDLAGPLGRGIETLAGWLFGYGRFAVPVMLAAIGVSFLRRGRSASPVQLAIGWGVVSLSALGLLHVLLGADQLSDAADEVVDAGGWIGALVGTPLEALLATAGAAVVLVP